MYIVVTRSFPPEVGGMQNLMWGLTCSLAKYNLVKVFADFHENYKEHDQKVSFSIDRVAGIKLLRKYVTENGKIMPSRITSVCQKKQRELSLSIKRARNLALI